MTWPTVAVNTTNTDAGTDVPATARGDILDLMQKCNQMIAHVSTLMATALDDTTAAAARATLGIAPVAGSRGLIGLVNAATPLTKYDLSATVVTLLNASGDAVIRNNTAVITCDLGLAGATANGRDQAGAFTASSWIYLYFIWNGTTLATIASASASSPTLPSGYTHWCLATALYWNGSSNIVGAWTRGRKVTYRSPPFALPGGTATSETAVSLTAQIPPMAEEFNAQLKMTDSGGVATGTIKLLTGVTWLTIDSTSGSWTELAAEIANIGQNIYYQVSPAVGAQMFIRVLGYTIPNNG